MFKDRSQYLVSIQAIGDQAGTSNGQFSLLTLPIHNFGENQPSFSLYFNTAWFPSPSASINGSLYLLGLEVNTKKGKESWFFNLDDSLRSAIQSRLGQNVKYLPVKSMNGSYQGFGLTDQIKNNLEISSKGLNNAINQIRTFDFSQSISSEKVYNTIGRSLSMMIICTSEAARFNFIYQYVQGIIPEKVHRASFLVSTEIWNYITSWGQGHTGRYGKYNPFCLSFPPIPLPAVAVAKQKP